MKILRKAFSGRDLEREEQESPYSDNKEESHGSSTGKIAGIA